MDDGAFPSLAIGTTQLFFEEEWSAFLALSRTEAFENLAAKLGKNSPFFRYLVSLTKKFDDLKLDQIQHA
ncbi:MAG: hypothetical protein JWQ35_1075 [Bacteriovoracaceae bacterium]|nr:hypothetical protein [Bacteriovoracaceae bacterium]